MAPITYYYFISIILASGLLLYIINLVYLRKAGRTTFGQVFPIGSPDYKSIVKKLANKRNLVIAIIIELFLLANLIWSVSIVWRVDTPDARSLLIFAPIVVAGLWVFMTIKLRKEYKTNDSNKKSFKKEVRKHSKDSDSWLS